MITDTPALPTDAPPKRRRWWLVPLVGILALVVCAGSIASAVILRYQPVDSQMTWGGPGKGIKRLPDRVIPSSLNTVIAYAYSDGRDLFYGFSLRNSGRWSVTVEEIELDVENSQYMLMRPVAARYRACCVWDDGRMEDFRPFRLAPGQSEEITVRVVMGDCEHYLPGSGSYRDSHRVRISFMGIDRWLRVPIAPVAVEIPSDYKCPRSRPF